MGRDAALIVHSELVDEARYDVFEVHREADGIVIVRRCWWFDEEVQQWTLDEASEWFLGPEQAMQLGMAIHQAAVPKLQRQAG